MVSLILKGHPHTQCIKIIIPTAIAILANGVDSVKEGAAFLITAKVLL